MIMLADKPHPKINSTRAPGHPAKATRKDQPDPLPSSQAFFSPDHLTGRRPPTRPTHPGEPHIHPRNSGLTNPNPAQR